MQTTKGVFKDVVDATVRALYDRSAQEQSTDLYYQKLGLTDYEPDVPGEVLNDLSGPTAASLSGEGQEYPMITKVNGYSVTLTMRKYAFHLVYTEEDMHWIAKSASSKRMTQVSNAIKGAVQSLNYRVNLDTTKVFYLGFGSTFLTVGNSETLFGSHTIKVDTSSQLNTFASGDTQRPLSATALVDAIAIMNRFKSHNGDQLLPVRSLKLIVAPEKIAEANRIIASDYGPDTPNLGVSASSTASLAKRGISIQAQEIPNIPYAYRNYWFLSETNRAAERAFMAWGWKPRMNDDYEYHNGTLHEFGSVLFGPVVLGWQWAFGSIGNSAAI